MKNNNKEQKKIKNELTEEQRNEIKEAFDLYDVNGIGKIEAKELKTALRALGIDCKKEEIKHISDEIEKFGEKGMVSFDQFMDIMGLKSV
jgi:centrin-1